ncbi:MAG TPA: hypothetical protein VGR02_15965 [Thermoanaerobaculia bacterium]|jgi:hypothetical protein|nr:hypothetical protein [Thermoanaerobaculia bacterium]
MRRTLSLAVCCLLFLFLGCKAKELADKAAISNDLDKRGTVDLMKEAANDKYDAPADGKLTDAQIQLYLKVREHEKKIVQVARQEARQHADAARKAGEKSLAGMMEGLKTIGSAADMVTADIRAAKDLGYNTQEYLWIKGKVLEASGAAMSEKVNAAMQSNIDASYAQMKKAYDEAKDETTKKAYADMLAGFDKQKQEMAAQKQQQDPALVYNRELLSKHEDALNAVATEMAKWSDRPDADTEKMKQELNKLGQKQQ